MTKAGAARFAALGSKLKDVQDRFLAPLEKAEREQLIDFLSRLGADKL
jgi:DNA-binding MarR family transcriptional regulator